MKTTTRLALDVNPEVKQMLKDMASAKGESMTQIVERLIRVESATSSHAGFINFIKNNNYPE